MQRANFTIGRMEIVSEDAGRQLAVETKTRSVILKILILAKLVQPSFVRFSGIRLKPTPYASIDIAIYSIK